MHIPTFFRQNNRDQLLEIIHDYPFATLITNSASGLEATHIPCILKQSDSGDALQGHIAKVNPLWKNVDDKSEVLVIFSGPDCYVSPSYYPTKKAHGRAVPTWNYITVHVKGVMSYVQDKSWNLRMLGRLTDQYEAGRSEPWSTSDAPHTYIDKMLSAIVGLEIEVESITGQWKLSQNQPEQNKLGVVDGLSHEQESNPQKIADLVKRNAL